VSELIVRFLKSQAYTRLAHWGKLIAITGGAQAIVQGTSLVCGILVIRLLPTQEYAWYTLANTMLGMMGTLADGGITIGVMSEGGKVWQDKKKLGVVLATGLDLRKRFGIGSLVVVIPILIYLLVNHGASFLTAFLITVSLIPAFFGALSDSLLEVAPKLHQDIPALQKNQIAVSFGRLLLSCLTLFVFPFTYIALLASGLPRIYGNRKLRTISSGFASNSEGTDKNIEQNILRIVKRTLPGAIYFCLSGQITIWLISIFGNTTSIAAVGALGRLAMLLGVVQVFVSTIIVPRFARLREDRALLLIRFFQVVVILLVFSLGVVGIFWLIPDQILLILGNQYAGLGKELVLIIIGGCISLSFGTVFNLCSSRGWILNPAVSIVINVLTTVVGINIFNISTVTGVLYLNIFIALVELIVHLFFATYKIRSISTSTEKS
jgi:O-antigen/teichoic acid export membrane protein